MQFKRGKFKNAYHIYGLVINIPEDFFDIVQHINPHYAVDNY